MKLLKNEIIVCEDGVIKLTMNPITTTIQGKLMELAMGDMTPSKSVERTRYALKEIVKSLEIDSKSYIPDELADKIDLSDETSRDIFINIGLMVMGEAFMGAEDEKKSEPLLKSGSSAGTVQGAHGRKTAKSRKKVA